jgi:hypothetical protein
LKSPLLVDYQCFLITKVKVGPILEPKFEAASLPSYTRGAKKKANLWRDGCKKSPVVECNSPGKIWPVCRYPNRHTPSHGTAKFMQNLSGDIKYYTT